MHTKNTEALKLALDGGHNVSLPGHTTHRLQPLDVAFFRPLSSYNIEESEKWLLASPGRCVNQAKVALLFGNE
jgi:hypothetical protein